MNILHIDLGLTDFNEVWKLQKKIFTFKQTNKCEDIIITNSHHHVYTLGKSGDKNHLLLNEKELAANNIAFYEIDRGGDLTYHGPGQLVVYPIFDLNNYYKDSHRFLRALEEVIIMTLREYEIDAGREEEFTGVWVEQEKICAIGIKLSRWITMHGLALNVNNDLSYFDKIIPCGIFHKGVTSMKNILGNEVDMKKLTEKIIYNFRKVFEMNIDIIEIDIEDLKSIYKI